MTEKEYVWILLGIFLTILYRNRDQQTGAIRLPPWVWSALGLFVLFMLLRHVTEVIDFFIYQADSWWPIVKTTAHDMADQLRHLFQVMKEGASSS